MKEKKVLLLKINSLVFIVHVCAGGVSAGYMIPGYTLNDVWIQFPSFIFKHRFCNRLPLLSFPFLFLSLCFSHQCVQCG